MLKYFKEYRMEDMRQVMRNSKAAPASTETRLDGKTCVITGATSGVGQAAAKRLHAYGADIVMVNRNPEKSERVAAELRASGGGGTVDYLVADFSELSQTRDAARALLDLGRPIDVLINNAGLHMTKRRLTVDGHEMAFAVNHLSPFILTRAILPRMKERGNGRIVQVNSQGHRFFGLNLKDLNWSRRWYVGLMGYGAAKTAQLLCTWEFDDELAGTPVTINAMHPGAVRTNVGSNNGRFYNWFQDAFVRKSLDDVEISGIALHYLAAAPELDGVSGKFFNLTTEEKPAPHALDRELGKAVWKVSCALTDRFLPS